MSGQLVFQRGESNGVRTILARDRTTGSLQWTFATSASATDPNSALVSAADSTTVIVTDVVMAGLEVRIHVLDGSSGVEQTSFVANSPARGGFGAVLGQDRAVVIEGETVTAHSLDDGRTLWVSRRVGDDTNSIHPGSADSFVVDRESSTSAMKLTSGKRIWEIKGARLVVSGPRRTLVSVTRRLRAVDSRSGRTMWQRSPPAATSTTDGVPLAVMVGPNVVVYSSCQDD